MSRSSTKEKRCDDVTIYLLRVTDIGKIKPLRVLIVNDAFVNFT